MNIHWNARLTFMRRLEMVKAIVDQKMNLAQAAAANGVSAPTARKWLSRYRAAGEAGLFDRGSRPEITRAYRPQTNGKAERFIESALRELAYGIAYNHSSERTAMLDRWTHHYNWHRPHQGIKGVAPMSRLTKSGNNPP